MSNTKITPTKNGPYKISGDFQIVDEDGNDLSSDQEVYLCRCGNSQTKPFCDGTHAMIHFDSDKGLQDE
jgi:CDGSH-type Zn-finger protein